MPTAFAVVPLEASVDDVRLTPHIILSSPNFMTLGGMALLAFFLLLPFWTAMDAAWRGTRPFAWGMLTLLTNVIGLLAYVIARPEAPRKCPNCGESVLRKFVRCPSCGVSVMFRCPTCGSRIKRGWQYCPVCKGASPGANARPVQVEPGEPVLPARQSTEPVGLTVMVRDALTGKPISGARIEIGGASPLEGLSNAAGFLEVRSPQIGPYTIDAVKDCYEAGHAETEISEGSVEVVTIDMTPLPGRIVGRVLEQGSLRAIAGASIYIDSARTDVSSESSASGAFELVSIPHGPYTVCVEAQGFGAQTKLVDVLPGREAVLDFGLEPGTVEGQKEDDHDPS